MHSHVTFRGTGRDQRGELTIEDGTASKSLLAHMQKGCDISLIHSSSQQETAMTDIKRQWMSHTDLVSWGNLLHFFEIGVEFANEVMLSPRVIVPD